MSNEKRYTLDGEVFDPLGSGPINAALNRCQNLQKLIYRKESTLKAQKETFDLIAKTIATELFLARHVPSQIEGLPGTWKTLDTLDEVVRELLKQREKGLK